MAIASLLLVIPDDDLSIDLFFTNKCRAMMAVELANYQNATKLANSDWDFIYIRGPFTQFDFNNQEVKDRIEQILQQRRGAYVVDGISRFSDLLLEDKWRQYKLFQAIMPTTELVESFKPLSMGNRLIKKRISGRSRDIHFSVGNLPEGAIPEDYISQERLEIQTEYRAFMVGGKLVMPLEIKTSKTEKTRNQVIGLKDEASKEVQEICREVSKKLKFDFMGLDIAKTEDGYYLLEANRSPQFINFLRLTSKNLAEQLYEYLLVTLEKKS